MHRADATPKDTDPTDMRRDIPYVDDFIHLNSAAGSLADRSVHESIIAHLDLEARCGNTEARLAVVGRINGLYEALSQLTNVPVARISVAESHTAAWQTALQALPLRAGDRILVAETEWGGNLSAIWQRCRATGAEMVVVPSGPTGAVDPAAMRSMLDARVKLVCITLVPAVNGLVNDIDAIAQSLTGHPAWLFVDAAQAFGNVLHDLSLARADLVTVSGRKYLRGPRGTGFATYSQRLLDEVVPLGLDQASGPWIGEAPAPIAGARRFEFQETSFAVRLGLAAAVNVALERDLGADMCRIADLAEHARAALATLSEVRLQDTHDRCSGIVTFSHARLPSADIRAALAAKRINVAAPGDSYAPLWRRAGRPAVTRLSPHAFNTHAEVETAVAAIAAL